MEYHNPVLLKESVDGLNIKPDGVYVDVTFGGGGHSKEILSRLNEKGKLFAFDQDNDAQLNTIEDSRFTLIPQNFRFIKRYLRFYGIKKVDLKYAGSGKFSLRRVERPGSRGIEIEVSDNGPGIPDVDAAMSDHFSSSGTLGLGLPGVERLMDEFSLESAPGQGTRVTARKWL